jgi:hypothetical protein
MPARTGYEHTPEFWNAYLASSVGRHLHGDQLEEQLAHDYERYLGSPAVCAELRAVLLPPLGHKKPPARKPPAPAPAPPAVLRKRKPILAAMKRVRGQ